MHFTCIIRETADIGSAEQEVEQGPVGSSEEFAEEQG
jgi:hypothetical protein